MKKTILLVFLACSLVAPVFTGCSNTANKHALKTQQVIIPSVNIAMEQWAVRVKAGKATQEQVDIVKIAYNNYYNAQIIFKAALEKSIVQANNAPTEVEVNIAAQALDDAKIALLNIISQFSK